MALSARHTHVYTPVILGLLLLSIGAIGIASPAADGKPAATKREINACTLLSDAEVSAAIALAVDPGDRQDSGWIAKGPTAKDGTYSSTCVWKVAADRNANDPNKPLGGARFAILNVMSWPAGSGEAGKFLQSFRDAAKNHVIPHPPVTLKLGDEALWWGDGVAVRKGDVSFGISVHLVNDRSRERAMSEALARKIVARVR